MGACLALLLVSLMGLAPAAAQAFEARDSMQQQTRGLTQGPLQGTLTLPQRGPPWPVALLLPGSGPVDRDGNLPGARTDALKALAEGLAENGIASLRIDKRGIGASGSAAGRESDLRFEAYVSDAVGWIDVLTAEPGTGPVFLIGHSEGALVATLAAQRRSVAGLILLAGAGFPAPELIAAQLAAANVPAELQARSAEIAATLTRQQPVVEVPAALAALYRPSVQPYLMSWFPLDPATELARVRPPVLIIQGTTDLQVREADARRLAAARPDARLVLIPGMNHVLKDAPAARAGNLATYNEPQRPLASELVPTISSFIAAQERAAQHGPASPPPSTR